MLLQVYAVLCIAAIACTPSPTRTTSSSMLQLKIAAATAATAVALHTYYVRSERGRVPTGRLLHFSPASQDAIIADKLKSGDLLLFSRDCSLYYAPGCLSCLNRQRHSSYDHAGLVILLKGEPHVAELTYNGVKLRPYDARIQTSRSKEIVLRPLGAKLTATQEKCLLDSVTQQLNSPVAGPITELMSDLVSEVAYNPSINFVHNCYNAAGLTHGSAVPSAYTPTSQPLTGGTFRKPVWIRDLR